MVDLNLFFAILNEHEDRTGHKVLAKVVTSYTENCNVCICLRAVQREMEAEHKKERGCGVLSPTAPRVS